MRVYFINLDRETERRAHMEQALRGLDAERVPAVNGHERPPAIGPLTRFQRACLESHRAAWLRFLATPAPFACFLEDDVHFSADFAGFLDDGAWIPAGADAVKLDTFLQPLMAAPAGAAPKGRALSRLYTRHESCAAYILSRQGAERFLRLTENPVLPVDYIVFPEDPARQGLALYQLAPAAAIQDSLFLRLTGEGKKFASGIGRLDTEKPAGKKRKLLFTVRREARRLYSQMFKAQRFVENRLLRGLKPKIIPFE